MKVIISFITVLFFIFPCSAYGQKTRIIDSLWQVYRARPNDSIKLRAANRLAFHYIFKNPSRADSILTSEIALAKQKGLFFNLTELTNTKGIYYDVLGVKDSSKIYFQKALSLSRTHDLKNIEVMCINNLGMFSWNNGAFKEAVQYFHEALNFSRQFEPNNDKGRSIYLNNIGLIYQELDQFNKAIDFHEKALAIRSKYDLTKDIAKSYNNLGICHKNLSQLDKAKTYIQQAINYAKAADQPKIYLQFYHNLGNIFKLQKNYRSAENAYLTALEPAENYDHTDKEKFLVYSDLIDLYNQTDQLDKARSVIENAERLIDRDSTLYNFSESFYINSAKTFFALQDKARANNYMNAYTTLKDSLFSKQNAEVLADVEAQLKTKEKEAALAKTKNELLSKELRIRRQNLYIYGGLSALILIIVSSYFIIKSKQLKNKQLQKEAELKTALAKIELKNKLEEQRLRISKDLHDNIGSQLTFVISGLQYIQHQKNIKVDDLKAKLNQLSDFTQQTIHELRDTIWAMNKESIELSDIISRLRNFINALDIKEDINIIRSNAVNDNDSHLVFNALKGVQVYRIIQESINNAVKHADARNINITFDSDMRECQILIEDDGKGFNPDVNLKGHGLQNMQSRAERIQARLDIKSTPTEGTQIALKVPIDDESL